MTNEKKPWEQEWRAEGCAWVERRGDALAVAQVKVSGSVEKQAEYTRFLAAAPDMARALMELLPDGEIGPNPPAHTRECVRWRTRHGVIDQCLPGCMEALAALRKAGVLP